MEYGGLQAFNKLLTDCRTDIETIEKGIKANDERKEAYKYLRGDISDFHHTREIYKHYREIKTKFFQERFRKKHDGEIIEHENAVIALWDYESRATI